jgi:hypothetical protein
MEFLQGRGDVEEAAGLGHVGEVGAGKDGGGVGVKLSLG